MKFTDSIHYNYLLFYFLSSRFIGMANKETNKRKKILSVKGVTFITTRKYQRCLKVTVWSGEKKANHVFQRLSKRLVKIDDNIKARVLMV